MSKIKEFRKPFFIGIGLIFAAVFLSAHLNIFELVPNLDKLFHFTGGIIAAWLAIVLISPELNNLRFFKQLLVVVGVACFIGVLWEFAEYTSTVLTYGKYPLLYQYFHGGDLVDTLGDLLADCVGAILFVMLRRK